MNRWQQALSWGVVSTLLFGGHFRAFFDPKVRYVNFVQGADVVPLLLAILILTALLSLVATLLSRKSLVGKTLAEILFLVALTQGLLVSLRPPAEATSVLAPLITVGVWCIAAIVLWKHCRNPDLHICDRFMRLSLIFAPLPVVLAVTFLRAPSLPPQTRLPDWQHIPGRDGTPVVIAIFDEWSFDRTFQDNSVPDWMPRLGELAGTSTLYSDANSAGPETLVSIPQMLFPKTGFDAAQLGKPLAPLAGPSLFDAAPQGYHRALVGFHLPYLSLLGGALESCEAFPLLPKGERLAETLAYRFADCLIFWQDPWAETLKQHFWYPRVFGPYWHQLGLNIQKSACRVLRTMPPNTICFFHFPFPHAPMTYAGDGSYRRIAWDESGDPALYKRNLLQVDRAVGELVDVLKARNLWDHTLLILSSDHGWRQDPTSREGGERGENVRHVPLIVKFPHQIAPTVVTNRFDLTGLADLIACVGEPRNNPSPSPSLPP